MKHKLTISGLIRVVEYCSESLDWSDNYYVDYQWRRMMKITVDDGDEDIKGKRGPFYITDYFHELFKDHPLPVRMEVDEVEGSIDYYIECDEFDPSKLQLIHRKLEIDGIPVVTGAFYIIYDGKKIRGEVEVGDFELEDPETFVVENFK